MRESRSALRTHKSGDRRFRPRSDQAIDSAGVKTPETEQLLHHASVGDPVVPEGSFRLCDK
jgi:hypothetical protein